MSMNINPIDQDPIDFIEETAAARIGARIREIRTESGNMRPDIESPRRI